MGAKPLVPNSPTIRLTELVDWTEFAHKLKGLYKRKATHGGRPGAIAGVGAAAARARFVPLPGLGHLAHEEAPERVFELLQALEAETGAAAG